MSRPMPLGWQIRVVLAALILAPAVDRIKLHRINRWIRRPKLPPRDQRIDDAALADLVDRLMLHLPGPWRRTSLKRAVALQYLARRAGRPAELHVDPSPPTAASGTHAWLVCDDEPYLEIDDTLVSAGDVLATLTPPAGAGE
ncbi:MAG: lasso peptide biosynthesis protein [Gemmatimonadales bacterium]